MCNLSYRFDDGDRGSVLYDNGCTTINDVALQRNEDLRVSSCSRIHVQCRKKYTDKRNIDGSSDWYKVFDIKKRTLRSDEEPFEFSKACFICASSIDKSNHRIRKGCKWFAVRSKDFDVAIKKVLC